MKEKKKQKISLGESAYQEIYRRIISLEFKPGQPLEEKKLMEHLNIGRTPIREALFRLSTELLVEAQPQKGFVVRPITLQNVKAMFEALELLETGVAELSVKQDVSVYLPGMNANNQAIATAIDEMDIAGLVEQNHEFHMNFARCSENEFIVRATHEVRCEANRLAYLSFSYENTLRQHYDSVICHHDKFIEYLKDQNTEKLKKLISSHIQAFKMRVVNYLTS